MLSDLRYWLRVVLGGVFAALADAFEEEEEADDVYEEQLLTVLTEDQAVALVSSHGLTLEVDDDMVRLTHGDAEDDDFMLAAIDYGAHCSRQQAVGWAVEVVLRMLDEEREEEGLH